jgi:hypothetical protein
MELSAPFVRGITLFCCYLAEVQRDVGIVHDFKHTLLVRPTDPGSHDEGARCKVSLVQLYFSCGIELFSFRYAPTDCPFSISRLRYPVLLCEHSEHEVVWDLGLLWVYEASLANKCCDNDLGPCLCIRSTSSEVGCSATSSR